MNMNRRGAFQLSSPVHQMVGDSSPILWDLNNMRPASTGHQQSSPLFDPSSCSSSTTSSSTTTTSSPVFPQYNLQPPTTTWHDNQELQESWSQLLLESMVEEELEDRCSYISSTPLQAKRMGNSSWEDQVLQLSEEVQAAAAAARSSNWSQILPTTSSPTNKSSSSSVLDFSNAKPDQRKLHHQLLVGDHSSECNSTPTGSPYKKARVQASSEQSTFKVRKEKLGDRITVLHQLVSPFGKTDTASVLLEAIGYIRFLQSQIQVLSSPYLATGSGDIKQQSVQGERSCIFPEDPGQLLNDNCMKRRGPAAADQDGVDEPIRKDLRSRGLCLVPASFITHLSSNNDADYWAPTFVRGFR